MANRIASINKQQGIATLLVSVMILIVLGLITLHTNRSVITEQRSASNEFKQALALEAAQSGMAKFIGQLSSTNTSLNWSNFFTQSGTTFTLKTGYANTINNKGYLNSTDGVFVNDFSSNKIAITATLTPPKNDAGDAVADINQIYKVFLAATSTPNKFKLISQGCTDTNDCSYAEAFTMTEFTVGQTAICPLDINGALTVTNSSSIHGLVNNTPNFNCGISVGSASGTVSDVIGCITGTCNAGNAGNYDPPYTVTGSAGKDAHFQRYFPGQTQPQVLAERTQQAAAGTACVFSGNATDIQIKACADAGKNKIYVAGDVNITSNALHNIGHGIPGGVELIVGGNLNLNDQAAMFFGFIYVVGNTGSSTLSGSLNVQGSAAFAGNVTGNLSFAVYASSTYSRPAADGGVQSNLTVGSWRDF